MPADRRSDMFGGFVLFIGVATAVMFAAKGSDLNVLIGATVASAGCIMIAIEMGARRICKAIKSGPGISLKPSCRRGGNRLGTMLSALALRSIGRSKNG
jgi:hypothetical protein